MENEDEIIKSIKEFIKGKIKDEEWNNFSVCKSLENKDNIEKRYIYNEFSLQHELGNYFRHLGYIVKFEYNVMDLNKEIETCKKEIDLLLIDKKDQYAIELKYLKKQAAVPKRMFQCIEDMRFMYDVVNNVDTIKKAYCVVITEHKGFYEGDYKEENVDLIIGDEKASYKKYLSNLEKKLKGKGKKSLSEKERKKIKKQIDMAKDLTSKPKKYPNIYGYFRKPKEIWENGKYIYNNSRDSLSIIDIQDLKDDVSKQFKWESISNDNSKEEQYYILKFDKKEE